MVEGVKQEQVLDSRENPSSSGVFWLTGGTAGKWEPGEGGILVTFRNIHRLGGAGVTWA